MTAPDLDALERAAQAADWTVNAASYAASWAFEKLATPAAVRAIIARLREAERRAAEFAGTNTSLMNDLVQMGMARDEAERQRDEVRAALDDIRLGAQVMDTAGCSIAVREFITSTKLRALSALPPPAGSETVPT